MPDANIRTGTEAQRPPAAAAAVLDRRVEMLQRIELFRALPEPLVTDVAELLRPIEAEAGAAVVRAGQPGDVLYLIESGTLSVEVGEGPSAVSIARLGPREFFGEMALITGEPRSATVRAESAVRLWAIRSTDLTELTAGRPELVAALSHAAERRRRSTAIQEYAVESINVAELLEDRSELRIGRASDNDLVLDSPVVSAHHAVLRRVGDELELVDGDSANGTYVNGARVQRAVLKDGDQIWLADQRLLFDRRSVSRILEPRGIRVEAIGLRKVVRGGKNLLQDIDLTVLPGELVAIVGGSGAGKSTLMDALSGVRPATDGEVRYNGQDLGSHRHLYRTTLGYVPQDDIIHTDLPLQVTLGYSAQLRLPRDTSPEERAAAVNRAVEDLGLTAHADTRVRELSGGQRKRASIGVELLTQPRIFFLDEPTSGLDPATDLQMMRLLRELADNGSTVLLTTHATKNVVLCDKIAFLARGGHLAFYGTPARALEYFGVAEFDEIYVKLEDELTPEEWGQRFRASAEHGRLIADRMEGGADLAEAAPELTAPPRGPRTWLRQLAVLSRRNAALYARNPGRVIPLIVQPLIFALLLVLLFRSGLFDLGSENPTGAFQLLFIFSLTCFLFGLLFGVQEVVKEYAIFHRERLVNLAVLPYLLSKVAFLAPVLVVCVAAMTLILWGTGRLPDAGWDTYGRFLLTLSLTAWCGLAIALFTSSVAKTPQMATDLLSVWIMPQVLFSGAIISVHEMNAVGELLSHGVALRWAVEGLGRVADLLTLFESSPSPIGQSLLIQFTDSFTGEPWQAWGILAGMAVGFLAVSWLILRRRTTIRPGR